MLCSTWAWQFQSRSREVRWFEHPHRAFNDIINVMQHAVCLSLPFLLFKILDLLPILPKSDGWKSAMFLLHTSKVEFLSRDGLRFYRTNYSENMFCRRVEELLLGILLWMKHPSTSQPQMLLKRVRVSTLFAKNIRMSLQWPSTLHDTYILDYSWYPECLYQKCENKILCPWRQYIFYQNSRNEQSKTACPLS